jgi:hypothetical protein
VKPFWSGCFRTSTGQVVRVGANYKFTVICFSGYTEAFKGIF